MAYCDFYFFSSFQADGRTMEGKITWSGGGVARNIADALSRLGTEVHFVSAVGRDHFGEFIRKDTLSHVVSCGQRLLVDEWVCLCGGKFGLANPVKRRGIEMDENVRNIQLLPEKMTGKILMMKFTVSKFN